MVTKSSVFVQTKLITYYLDYELRFHKRRADELNHLYLFIGGSQHKDLSGMNHRSVGHCNNVLGRNIWLSTRSRPFMTLSYTSD